MKGFEITFFTEGKQEYVKIRNIKTDYWQKVRLIV